MSPAQDKVKTAVTGIKPTLVPHLGNFMGAIAPGLELAKDYRALYFIADYHALTTVHDRALMRSNVYDVTAAWLASGVGAPSTIVFRQSEVPEVFELAWILSCVCGFGQLERGHAYKDVVARGESPNAGVFMYPVLMSADILLYDANVVPVGPDQKQHVEIARDLAIRVNHMFGDGTLVVPEVVIRHAESVPGLDGRKMSKSYGNTIPIFSSKADLKDAVMKIKTGSESLEEPKTFDGTLLHQIMSACATPSDIQLVREKLAAGNYGWGHAKLALFELLDARFAPVRERYAELRRDTAALDVTLAEGSEKARQVALPVLTRVREAIGIR